MSRILAKERQGVPCMHEGDQPDTILYAQQPPFHWPFELLVVLVQGGRGDDYAAYKALIPCMADNCEAVYEWVARHGNKCSWKEAQGYFSGLEEDKYRL